MAFLHDVLTTLPVCGSRPRSPFRREFRIDFSCLYDGAGRCANIDFVVCPLGAPANNLMFLEVDEHQHRFYAGGVT